MGFTLIKPYRGTSGSNCAFWRVQIEEKEKMKWILRFTENHLHRSLPAVRFTSSDGAQTGSNLDAPPLAVTVSTKITVA